MSNTVAAEPSEPEWAALAAIDWADQKNFWRLLPADRRKSEAGELDNTPEAVEVWAANLQQLWRPTHCGDSRADSWRTGVYAHQVPALGVVPGPPNHRGALSEDLRGFRCQERPQRY